MIKKLLDIFAIMLVVLVACVIVSLVVDFSVNEDGSYVLTCENSEMIPVVEHDNAGNEYIWATYTCLIAQGQIPFLFGESPSWWGSLVGEEWLDKGEVNPQDINLGTPTEFWMCWHTFNVCFGRSDPRPLIYRVFPSMPQWMEFIFN